jgi:hypothetical protein
MITSPFPPGWRIVTAETTGPDHLTRGLENQDAHAYRRLGDGFVLAAADGAGSREWSAWGSRTAVDTACQVARSIGLPQPERATWLDAGRRFADDVCEQFDRKVGAQAGFGPQIGDFATTLLVLVAQPPAYLFLSVGDGFAVVEHQHGGAHLVMPPDAGPDDGTTMFLTSPGRQQAIRLNVLIDEGVRGVALCTDGLIEAVLAADRGPHGRRLRAPEDFGRYFSTFARDEHDPGLLTDRLRSAEFAATSRDDKTMVIAVRT